MTDRTLFLGAVMTTGFTALVLELAFLFNGSYVDVLVAILPLVTFVVAAREYGLGGDAIETVAGSGQEYDMETAGGDRNRRQTTTERN